MIDITNELVSGCKVKLKEPSRVDGSELTRFLARGGEIITDGWWLIVDGDLSFPVQTVDGKQMMTAALTEHDLKRFIVVTARLVYMSRTATTAESVAIKAVTTLPRDDLESFVRVIKAYVADNPGFGVAHFEIATCIDQLLRQAQ